MRNENLDFGAVVSKSFNISTLAQLSVTCRRHRVDRKNIEITIAYWLAIMFMLKSFPCNNLVSIVNNNKIIIKLVLRSRRPLSLTYYRNEDRGEHAFKC